jgi:hypothetical protein
MLAKKNDPNAMWHEKLGEYVVYRPGVPHAQSKK